MSVDRSTTKILNSLKDRGQDEVADLILRQRSELKQMIAARIQGKLASRLGASDVIQETYIRASKCLSRYLLRPAIKPKNWIRQLCNDAFIDLTRFHLCKKRSLQNEAGSCSQFSVTDSAPSAGHTIERDEDLEAIYEFLNQLPKVDRDLIELRHIGGLSYRDLAQEFKISENAVKQKYYRILKKLKTLAANQHPLI